MLAKTGPAVAVTGLGSVTGYGRGIESFWRGLCRGETNVRGIDHAGLFDPTPHRTQIASFVDQSAHRSASRADRFAGDAAIEAVVGAFGSLADLPREDAGVFFGSSTGALLETERVVERILSNQARLLVRELASQQHNGPGDEVARRLGVHGAVVNLSSACASSSMAIGAALDALRDGEVRVAIAGGSDELSQITYAGFNSLRAVDAEPTRPFRADRDGLSLGEGAGVLVLEDIEHATERGAAILGYLAGAGATCDAHHMSAPKGDGSGAAAAIRVALSDAGIATDEIDFINVHGTGTPQNDAAEWAAIRTVFGDRAGAIPISATKSAVGHLLGASGGIEAVATVLCLQNRLVPGAPGSGSIDPELPVNLVLGDSLELPRASAALSTNLAFGGANSALAFRASIAGGWIVSSEVVLTGAAAIGPHGLDLDALRDALREGRPLARPAAPSPWERRRRATSAASVPTDLDLSEWVAPRAARRMSQSSKWAVAAGRMALSSAGFESSDSSDASDDGAGLGVCLATAFGPSGFTSRLVKQILAEDPKAASPFLFTDCVANAPCGQLAIGVRARAANTTVVQREAGPLLALHMARREILGGRADAVLAGAVDELDDYVLAILDRMGALATDASHLRPLADDRSGILFGEGASVVVVESASKASGRGANVLARIAATVRGFDPTATGSNWGAGAAALAARLQRGLDAAGIATESIDAVVSGASGAKDGDQLEAEVLAQLFADTIPPVLVPKAVVGEYGGGVIVPSLLILRGGTFGLSYSGGVASAGVVPFRGELAAPRRILVTGLGSGGAAAWCVLDAPRGV